MINSKDILETIKMIDEEYLDVRTITMGISLLDCADADIEKSCEKIYRKITTLAKDLVKVGNDIFHIFKSDRKTNQVILNSSLSTGLRTHVCRCQRRRSDPLCADTGALCHGDRR